MLRRKNNTGSAREESAWHVEVRKATPGMCIYAAIQSPKRWKTKGSPAVGSAYAKVLREKRYSKRDPRGLPKRTLKRKINYILQKKDQKATSGQLQKEGNSSFQGYTRHNYWTFNAHSPPDKIRQKWSRTAVLMKVLCFISLASFAGKALAHFMIQADFIPIHPVIVDGVGGSPCC